MKARRLRFILFVVVAVAQLAVAGGAIIRSELALRTGEVFRFRIQPVDPVDAFRGRYVAIRFALDRAPAPDGLELRHNQWVFVPLQVDSDGFAAFGPAALDPCSPFSTTTVSQRCTSLCVSAGGRQPHSSSPSGPT